MKMTCSSASINGVLNVYIDMDMDMCIPVQIGDKDTEDVHEEDDILQCVHLALGRCCVGARSHLRVLCVGCACVGGLCACACACACACVCVCVCPVTD